MIDQVYVIATALFEAMPLATRAEWLSRRAASLGLAGSGSAIRKDAGDDAPVMETDASSFRLPEPSQVESAIQFAVHVVDNVLDSDDSSEDYYAARDAVLGLIERRDAAIRANERRKPCAQCHVSWEQAALARNGVDVLRAKLEQAEAELDDLRDMLKRGIPPDETDAAHGLNCGVREDVHARMKLRAEKAEAELAEYSSALVTIHRTRIAATLTQFEEDCFELRMKGLATISEIAIAMALVDRIDRILRVGPQIQSQPDADESPESKR